MKKLILILALFIGACGSPESIPRTSTPAAHYGPMERVLSEKVRAIEPSSYGWLVTYESGLVTDNIKSLGAVVGDVLEIAEVFRPDGSVSPVILVRLRGELCLGVIK